LGGKSPSQDSYCFLHLVKHLMGRKLTLVIDKVTPTVK
jgi:hypothetical protein